MGMFLKEIKKKTKPNAINTHTHIYIKRKNKKIKKKTRG